MAVDPQTLVCQRAVELEQPVAGRARALSLQLKFSESPGDIRCAVPTCGQHKHEMPHEYGFSGGEITALAASGAVHLGR